MATDIYHIGLDSFDEIVKTLPPYREAISVMESDTTISSLLDSSVLNQIDAISKALSTDVFDDHLSRSVNEMLKAFSGFTDVQKVVNALGTGFESFVNPHCYDSFVKMIDVVTERNIKGDVTSNKSFFSTLLIDEFEKMSLSNWIIEKERLASIDTSSLSGINNSFASLLRLEQKTAQLSLVPNNVVSVSSQIASLISAMTPKAIQNTLSTTASLLSDYCNMANKQYAAIQQSNNLDEINWHLDLLKATSIFVDRQVQWNNDFMELMPGSIVDLGEENMTDCASSISVIKMIPSHIGYTKRNDISETPIEGLEKSYLVTITEKGKEISEKIICVNNLQLDNGNERVFEMNEKVAMGLIDISNVVCVNSDQLGKVIDSLYFVFYENLERIKKFLGDRLDGDGNRIVREDSRFQCIFDVKTIRNEYRHDLNHGTINECRKKHVKIGECYKRYCGGRPLRERDFKILQNNIYKELVSLVDYLIDLLKTN